MFTLHQERIDTENKGFPTLRLALYFSYRLVTLGLPSASSVRSTALSEPDVVKGDQPE